MVTDAVHGVKTLPADFCYGVIEFLIYRIWRFEPRSMFNNPQDEKWGSAKSVPSN